MSYAEAINRAIDEARASQPYLNAFTQIEGESAVESARTLPAPANGPLVGVPFAVKDLLDHAGRTTTNGSAFYRRIPEASAPAVVRMEQAGAVSIGRTGLHEFAFGFSSENPHWGPVRNPWNLDHSTGGSSGGSGAVVAAGIVPIAIGTDTGGSVRVPAALCGTFGLKVTHGRIPLDGVFPLVPSIDTVGPLASSMAYIESSYRVMSQDASPADAPSNPSVGIPEPWFGDAPLSDEVSGDFDETVAALEDLGWSVKPVSMANAKPTPRLWNAIAEEVTEVHRSFREAGETYGEDVTQRLEDAEAVTPAMAEDGYRWQRELRSELEDVFGNVDFLLTPTVPVKEKTIGVDNIGDAHYRSVISYFTAVVNHALTPALAAPLSRQGAPSSSIQLIAPWDAETRLIAAGHRLEEAGIVEFRTAPKEFT